MKVRKEISGLHYFDRVSGLHILLDEVKIPKDSIMYVPRTVSIALTNICDLKCPFCYAPKNKATHSFEYLTALCKKLDDLGVLEVTFGGGEPTLFPEFDRLCCWVWDHTSLGISFTTHGHHLSSNFIENIRGKISSIRFSIDGLEPRYSLIRGRNLNNLISNIKKINSQIPFGINCVVSKNGTAELSPVIELAIELGAANVLIIPEHENGLFLLTNEDWKMIDEIINSYRTKIEILVTYEADNFLASDTLEISNRKEFLFAHITADNKLKIDSFGGEGIQIENISQLNNYFLEINPN